MSLAAHIRARIGAEGPISVASFMADALGHPELGYYATRDPLGAAGDFTTAPEISQMFGELVGLALAQNWLDQGAPAPFTLAELGPGRGTLMADMMRATARVPGFHAAAQLWLVETSPVLRARQAETLAAFTPQHAETVAALPDRPTWLVANEFFDALPIHQYVREGDHWRERVVGLDGDRLAFGLSGPVTPPELTARLADTEEGALVETCPAGAAILAELAPRLTQGGATLIIDYGDWDSLGDTLQALKSHAPVDPLATPGEADLTAHVDFAALARAAAPLIHSRLAPQGVFLERLGIGQRAEILAARLDGPALASHLAAHRRLTSPDEMGTLFKVLGLTAPGAPMLPGLTP